MRGAVHGQRPEVCHGQIRPAVVEHPGTVLSTQYRGDLKVDQFRGGQRLTPQPGASGIPVRAVIGQRDRKDAGVNDEHDPPAQP